MTKVKQIDGEKVFLIPISDNDTDNIVRWRNQREIRDWFLDRRDFTMESHRRWLVEVVKAGKAVQWIIHEKPNGDPIGTAYLRDIDNENHKCEFGIYIGNLDKYGLGYGKETVGLVTDYAFSHLNLKKVYLKVLAINERAINSYKAAGYVVEGVSRMDRWIEEKPIDIVFMAKYSSERSNDK